MPQFEIIVPHYGTGELTDKCLACLRSVREHSQDYRLILVDNGSPEFHLVADELDRHHHYQVIRNSENLGFVKATNQGLAMSTAPLVVLLNNDTIVVPDWLNALHNGLLAYPGGRGMTATRSGFPRGAGLAGPLSTAPGSWQGKWETRLPDPYLLGPNTMLAFFCVMISRAVLETPGLELLDETYGVGFGDDDEYCRRAQRAGWGLSLVQSIRVEHAHRSTFRTLYTDAEIKAMQDGALRHFQETA